MPSPELQPPMLPEEPDLQLEESLPLRYTCEAAELGPDLAPLFRGVRADADTRAFIAGSRKKPHGALQHGLQRSLRRFFSDFDVNGLLGTYPMHLLSTSQWQALLGTRPGGKLLDVGAGDGRVTEPLAALFDEVCVTETSRAMAWRLRRRGYTCFNEDVSHCGVPGAPYDAIGLLNVLDRCAAPLSLLSSVTDALRPGGLLIVALALPYRPFFYAGFDTPSPLRPLPLSAEMGFEHSVRDLVAHALKPLALSPLLVSRAPYLSWGDRHQDVYFLDDAFVICRKQ